MLTAAFGNWIDAISERGFDGAFLCLLRANGYHDVHFTHGSYEFGRDVVAKITDGGRVIQCAFQSKAGDISGNDWEGMFSQLFELVTMPSTHPSFDQSLPRRCFLVTTGQLKGKAAQSAENFRAEMKSSKAVDFEVLDRGRLIEQMKKTASHDALAGSSSLIEALGRVVSGNLYGPDLEMVLARLSPQDPNKADGVWRAVLDNSICARAFSQRNQPFHALTALLNGVRIGACVAHASDVLGQHVLREAKNLYAGVGGTLVGDFLRAPDDPRRWLDLVGGVGAMFSYPSACLRIAELLGLSALFHREEGRDKEAAASAELLRTVVMGQPGCSHPVSDRYAGALSCGLAALAAFGHLEACRSLLVGSVNWLCSRYENSEAGLAGAYASPEEEVRVLLGAPFEGVNLTSRRDSLLAICLADAAHVFAPDLYADVLNDFQATGIVSHGVHAEDDPDAYRVSGAHTRALLNIAYPATAQEPLPHHALQVMARTPERIGGPSVCLALSALLGDRLFSDCFPRIA
jgi:hypothetical protein